MSRRETSHYRRMPVLAAVVTTVAVLVGFTPVSPAGALGTESSAYNARALELASSIAPSTSYPTMEVAGHGWGHGRGMSQYGAYGYASGDNPWTSAQILDHYYSGTVAGTVPDGFTGPDPTNLRVELRSNRDIPVRVDVELGTLQVLDGESVVFESELDSGQAIRVTTSETGLQVESSTSCSGPWQLEADVAATSLSILGTAIGDNSDSLVRVCEESGSSTWYDGSLSTTNLDGSMRLVNTVTVEEYLRGVVPREVPAGWPSAALEAQAVAARSYVLAGDTRQQPYADTCDSTLCQVYKGRFRQDTEFLLSTHERTDAAIAATAGIVRLFGSSVARTEFSSSSGGYTAGGTFAAVIDEGDSIAANPNHDWSVSVNLREFEEDENLGHLTSVAVTQRNGLGADGGRAQTVVFSFTGGSVTKTASQVRQMFGLKSDWFTPGAIERVYTDTAASFYIDHMFSLFLERQPTDVERAAWVTNVELDRRFELTNALVVSNEWAGVMIDRFYNDALGRGADDAGRQHWLGQVASGVRIETIGAHFYGSPEYFAQAGGTNEGFVRALYRDLLGREADAGGLASWAAALDSGAMTTGDVAAGFYASIESRESRVRGLYQRILLRGPDSAGLVYWAGQLLHTDDIRLASDLAASSESFGIAQP